MATTKNTTTTKVTNVEVPSVDWVVENRKKKDGKKMSHLTGHNIFVMVWVNKFHAGFPAKGIWETYNKAAWDAVAVAYNATL